MADLKLDEYQTLALRTDKTKAVGDGFDLPLLGLVGEIGSLLSEVKKKQRDSNAYVGYESSVVEELGDTLWYLAIIADHAGIKLSEIAISAEHNDFQTAFLANSEYSFLQLQQQQSLPLNSPSVAFEKGLLRLSCSVGNLTRYFLDTPANRDRAEVIGMLGRIFKQLIDASNDAGVILANAALQNLNKATDRWPAVRNFPILFDKGYPEEEQLPRHMVIDIFERSVNSKTYVLQRSNGIFIGDRLTDNIVKRDDYRFHDVFHYAYASVLGWSPVLRSLLRLKRKSRPDIDEGEDGARAALIEEGVASFIFGEAKQLNFFREQKELSLSFLNAVRRFVKGYESDQCPLWVWEEAILQGSEAFRFLQEHRSGRLTMDLMNRKLTVENLPNEH